MKRNNGTMLGFAKFIALFFTFGLLHFNTLQAQDSSKLTNTIRLPNQYFSKLNNKVDKYSSRITSKTEKLLSRLSRWEKKINTVLTKVNPEVAAELFGKNQTGFTQLLEKIKEGNTLFENTTEGFDEYRDKLSTEIQYFHQQKESISSKYLKPLDKTADKMDELNALVDNTDALKEFIRERKKQLLKALLDHAGKSKYVQKMNKAHFYYVQTLANYKEIFSDEKKFEQTLREGLSKIPAFQKFMEENSMLAGLFGMGGGTSSNGQPIPGLQTREQVYGEIQQRLLASGPNAQQQFQQNMQAAMSQLDELKKKLGDLGISSGDVEDMPNFKPNMEKTKTFWQRLEYGTDFQSQGVKNLLPTTTDLGLSVGYKLNKKSVIGVGASYKLGWGTGWDNIRLTGEGLGLRSFINWKLKGSFYIAGGYELNYRPKLEGQSITDNFGVAHATESWQESGLIGISKIVATNTKILKNTKLQLLWDFLSYRQVPRTQQFIFRVGYGL